MQNSEKVLINDIHEINLAYLLLAQRLLQKNFTIGRFRLGLSKNTAHELLGLTSLQLIKLAQTKRAITHFALNEQQLRLVLEQDRFGSLLQQAHLTILATQRSIAEETTEYEQI